MKDERPFDCVCDAVVFQAKTLKHTMEAMSSEAQKQARALEAVLSYFDEPSDLGEPAPLHMRHHRPRTSIKGAIAFLRDLCGPSIEEGER